MQIPQSTGRPAERGSTEASVATRQRFIDAAVAYLIGVPGPDVGDEGRRTTTMRGGAGHRDSDRRSPDTLGIRLVAQLTGVTHAAPLYYFPDRTVLVAAVAAEGFRLMRQALVRMAAPRGSRLPRVVEDALHYVQWAGDHAALFSAMYDPALAADLELLQRAELSGTSALEAFGERHGGKPRALGRRVEAFEELLAAKVALLAFFSERVSEAVADGALRSDRPVERVTYALTSMADGLAWQRITEPQSQGAAHLLDRHARACLLLLLEGIAGAEG
jgi:hypothetical protein